MAHERKRQASKILEELHKKWEENPIVEELPDDDRLNLTKEEHIKELQERLVQTCIDYINEKGLVDIYSVSFNADSLAESAKYGSWQPCTDSHIKVKGLCNKNYKRKNGNIFKMPYWYEIGEYM